MSVLEQEVRLGIAGVLQPEFDERSGYVVPRTEDINLANGAVRLQATYLYADMADSTGLAHSYKDWAVAKVIRCYLNAASRLIKANNGEIRSFDGDRVMGIFIGTNQENDAVRAAMSISWAVSEVIRPALINKWNDLKWTMSHGVGIDNGEALLVRGGVRGNNDIVSIGHAPNLAAKFSEFRDGVQWISIADSVKDKLSNNLLIHNGLSMWAPTWKSVGGRTYQVFQTSYMWTP